MYLLARELIDAEAVIEVDDDAEVDEETDNDEDWARTNEEAVIEEKDVIAGVVVCDCDADDGKADEDDKRGDGGENAVKET